MRPPIGGIVLLQPMDCGGYDVPAGAHLSAWDTGATWAVLFHGAEIEIPKHAARPVGVVVDAAEAAPTARDEEYNEVTP